MRASLAVSAGPDRAGGAAVRLPGVRGTPGHPGGGAGGRRPGGARVPSRAARGRAGAGDLLRGVAGGGRGPAARHRAAASSTGAAVAVRATWPRSGGGAVRCCRCSLCCCCATGTSRPPWPGGERALLVVAGGRDQMVPVGHGRRLLRPRHSPSDSSCSTVPTTTTTSCSPALGSWPNCRPPRRRRRPARLSRPGEASPTVSREETEETVPPSCRRCQGAPVRTELTKAALTSRRFDRRPGRRGRPSLRLSWLTRGSDAWEIGQLFVSETVARASTSRRRPGGAGALEVGYALVGRQLR